MPQVSHNQHQREVIVTEPEGTRPETTLKASCKLGKEINEMFLVPPLGPIMLNRAEGFSMGTLGNMS